MWHGNVLASKPGSPASAALLSCFVSDDGSEHCDPLTGEGAFWREKREGGEKTSNLERTRGCPKRRTEFRLSVRMELMTRTKGERLSLYVWPRDQHQTLDSLIGGSSLRCGKEKRPKVSSTHAHTTHNTQHTTHNTQHTTHNTHALADLAKDGNTWFGPFSALVRVGRNMRGM